MKMVIWVKDRE